MRTIATPQVIITDQEHTVANLTDQILRAVIPAIEELIRRAVDGTIPPLLVDYNNQRIIIGASAASTSNIGKVEITGDAKVLGAGNGLILPTRNGLKFGRVILENPDSNGNLTLSVDPL